MCAGCVKVISNFLLLCHNRMRHRALSPNQQLNFYVADIEAECQDDYMKIRVGFNGSFTGLVYSAGKKTYFSIITINRVAVAF